MPDITTETQRNAVLAFGVVFVAVLLMLAMVFPEPTAFQYTVFRIVLAVAAAGVAAFLPGFLEANIGHWIRAGGAMAAFAVMYFFNPAGLVSDVAVAPAPMDPFTIHVFESTPDGETRANRFTFRYVHIEERASYSDFAAVLVQLPGVGYSEDEYRIFRTRDGLILNGNSRKTAVSGNNTGVLVIPDSILDEFDEKQEAFVYLLDFVRDVD